MKKRYEKLISVVLCCLILFFMFTALSNFLESKSSYKKNADFYSNEGDFDVLFLGSSHMIMAIAPMELWNDYGIVSYNLADHGQQIPGDYWILKNALEYTKPKLVVIDLFHIDGEAKISDGHDLRTHEMFDMIPISRNKISAIYDLYPEGKRMEFLFPFSIYHSRWDEIDATFFEAVHPSTQKGADLDYPSANGQAIVKKITPREVIDKSQMNLEETVGKEYLRKIIELCQDENIDILLTALPCSAKEEKQKWYNSIQVIADEYNIDYLDLVMEDTFVNYNTDFFDAGHMNSSGARKVTEVMGAYIADRYHLTDWRQSDIAPAWNQDYVEYTNFKIDWLKEQTSLDAYLMLLADKKFDAIIEIYDAAIWQDSTYVQLLENLGVDMSQVTEETDCIVVREGGKDADMIDNFHRMETVCETSIGELAFVADELEDDPNGDTGAYSIYLNQEERYVVTPNKEAGIGIFVVDKDTLETCDSAAFYYSVDYQRTGQIISPTNQ